MVLSMADGKKPKVRHINMSSWAMVLPWQASLHKLHTVADIKFPKPFHYGRHLTTMLLGHSYLFTYTLDV